MKLCIVIMTVFCMSVAANTYSQQQRISLDKKNVKVVDLFKEIQKRADLYFIFNTDDIKKLGKVTVAVKDKTVESVLKKVLADSNLKYDFEENVIVIRPTVRMESGQQVQKIKGVVKDKDGNPIPGVSVVIKGTQTGVTSDVDGKFNIEIVPMDNITLVFSFVGMKSKEVKFTGKDLSVVLEEDTAELEEVVVTGYQEIKKDRMTGSVKTITANSIRNKGVTSMDEVLEGSIAGITSIASGRPGEDAQITIRGVNSLSGSTAPIWIVDGMPLQGEIPNITVGANSLQNTILTSGIGNISPDDIKSITVLKDAAATAIYGSRAANGVIVVETKTGHTGKTFFNFTANYSLTEKPKSNVRMMNTAEKIQYEKLLYNDFNSSSHLGRVFDIEDNVRYGRMSRQEADAAISDLANIQTDWFDEIFRTAMSQQYNFSMSGGDEKTQYYASANWSSEKGTVPNNKYDKMGINLKLTHNPNKKARITLGLTSTIRKDRSTASNVNPLQYAMYANTYEKPYNEDGSYAYDLSYNIRDSRIREGLAWGKFNILHDLNNNTNTSRYLNAVASLKFEYNIIPGLMFTSHGVINYNSNHNTTAELPGTYTNFINNWNTYNEELTHDKVEGSLKESTGRSDGYTFRNTLQYNKEFDGVHYVNVFVGQEISQRKTNNFFNYSPVFDNIHYIIGFPDLTGTSVKPKDLKFNDLGGTGMYEEKSSSFFANASYSYMDKYVVSGAIRYDGSDIIGNKNQFSPLWNVAFRWNMHKEDFLKSYSFIDVLSLRGGYGYTGSIDKNALPFLILKYQNKIKYDDSLVPTSFDFPNPNIKWQRKKDRNIGMELAMFGRRVEMDINYYNNLTEDVLDSRRLAYSSGRNIVVENVASIINKGWEIELSTTNIRTKDFTWITRFNIALNDNKIKAAYYKSLDDVPNSVRHAFVEGYPVNAWYGYKFADIDKNTGETLVYTGIGDKTFNMDRTGNVTLNLTPPSISYLGDKYPPVVGGFSSTFSYKRFILSANMEFKTGHKVNSFNTITAFNSKNRYVTDQYRWRQVGDITNVPKAKLSSNAYGKYMYDVKLERGDYMRLNLMSLGYNVDPKLLNTLGLKSARLSATARNLFTLTKYRGIDPSLMGEFGYPNSRRYTVTLNLGF